MFPVLDTTNMQQYEALLQKMTDKFASVIDE
jgi:hypothetical protein